MVDLRAYVSAYVEKWTSTSSILSHHCRVRCLSRSARTSEQPQGRSLLLFLGIDISVKYTNTNTVHCDTCGWAEAELAPLQKPFV